MLAMRNVIVAVEILIVSSASRMYSWQPSARCVQVLPHPPGCLLLGPNPSSLSPVVRVCYFFEPSMIERLLGCDAFARVVDENLLEKVQEKRQEFTGLWYDFLLGISKRALNILGEKPTESFFIALTNLRDPRVVSDVG